MADPITRLDEMRVQATALILEIDELTALPDPTETEIERLDAATTEAEELRGQIEASEARFVKAEERQKKVAELRSFMKRPGYMASGEDSGPDLWKQSGRDVYDLSGIRTVGIPKETVAREFRALAREAVEQAPEWMTAEQRETAIRHVDLDGSGEIAKHYLEHGSPEYTDAWFAYIRSGEKRAALTTTGANGGYLIPFHLDPSVILTNVGTVNPFREISKVATISTGVWHGVSSAGVTAEWTAEAAEVTDASPTFAQPTIPVYRADAYVQASREVVEDAVNLASEIAMMFADARDRLESAAFAVGTGSGQPTGIVTALQLTTASRVSAQTNGGFGAVDVFALVNNLPARYQQNCVWVAHWWLYNLARQFGGANQPNFWVDLGPGIPSQLLGRSTYQSSQMLNAGGNAQLSSATASSDDVLILGDFSVGYQIVDRIGMEVLFDPLVHGANRRPTGEVGWTAFWRVGADSVNDDAFRMLRV